MTGPLDGLLVVSIDQAVAAPYAASRLADAGARVIKVERPGGDFARRYDTVANGQSAYFVWLNRGKESIELDIKDAGDAALLERMIARADVFVQNLAPGAAARAGFGSDELRRRHPRLITCDISGYGEDGPYRDMKAYDLLVQAETGLSSITGSPESPGRVGVSVCDIAAGMYGLIGILEALHERARTGRGKGVQVSLFDSLADWMAVPFLYQEWRGAPPPRVGLNHPSIAPYGRYAAGDGGEVVVSIQNEREWRSFCATVLQQAELADDPRFADNEARVRNRPELDREIAAVFGALSRPQVIERLRAGRIAYGNLNAVADLAAHPQFRRGQSPTEAGDIELPASPIQFDGTRQAFRPVPALNQHGDALRREFAEQPQTGTGPA
ncbi:MAG: CaiB/BaiF CoA-transferase family protein [Alphaproteobacteria bacterium]|nr:CaiB/BaiF CoA-transferase family protein [Alphaproteobacteria bacterium]